MEQFANFLKLVDDALWGWPLMILILAGGFLLTIRVRVLQVHKLPLALKWMVMNEEGGEGEISSFGALCTALSATIGTGNIVGVATAIGAGGPGALFWMLVAAFFGMATKYAEGLLAVKYRVVDEDGHALGGPFYYIERGMGEKWKWLAKMFAVLGVFGGLLGIGTITQVNGISNSIQNFFDPNKTNLIKLPIVGNQSIATILAAVIVAAAVALVVIGGSKRISAVATLIVPFMAVAYVILCLSMIIFNYKQIPDAIVTIVTAAFNPRAITGGAVGTMFVAMSKGVARGIFSNEAGLGSAPIAAAAAMTKEPVRQGLVSMTGTFIDTIIICTMTGLSIVLTGAWKVDGLEGVQVTAYAFTNGLPISNSVVSFILMMCLVFFAFTTILGWDFYSERCMEYLTKGNRKLILTFRWAYIFMVFIGPFMTVAAVWTVADICNALMALPNMIALFALSGVVAKETKGFFERKKQAEK